MGGMTSWQTVIGLEVHVELSTRSKIFCGCATSFGAEPNTQCCPVCMGLPGALPVLNKKVLEYAVLTGVALGCDIAPQTGFDRKAYFYPDLPKGYQITQLRRPFATNGRLELDTPEGRSAVRIHEIHMEEDAGKLLHAEDGSASYPDFNRSGVPLLEIVSAPEMHDAEQAVAYLEALRSVLLYLGVSDCRMQEGSMRVDVNVSVCQSGAAERGERTEMKNLGSLRAVRRAIRHEAARQIKLLEAGGRVLRQTRRWDDMAGQSFVLRAKEEAQDYRYLPEPDIPQLNISRGMVADAKSRLPEFAPAKAARLEAQYGLAPSDAALLAASRGWARLFEDTVKLCGDAKQARYWMLGPLAYFINQHSLPQPPALDAADFAHFIGLVSRQVISREAGKQVLEAMLLGGAGFDAEAYIGSHGLWQLDDDAEISRAVGQVLEANPVAVGQYHSGKQKVFGFLMGEAMRAMHGRAQPDAVAAEMRRLLDKQ